MSDIDAAIGRRVRARRQALKLNQTELGERIGVRFQQVQKYETGANRISAARLWKLADVLNVPVGFFFEGLEGGSGAPAHRFSVSLEDPETLEVLDLIHGLPHARREAILAMLRTMKGKPAEVPA